MVAAHTSAHCASTLGVRNPSHVACIACGATFTNATNLANLPAHQIPEEWTS